MDPDLNLQLDEQQILDKFDRLVAEGTIVYDHDYRVVRMTDQGLSVSFRPSLPESRYF